MTQDKQKCEKRDEPYKIASGKYKGYQVCYSPCRQQIFMRRGVYLMKSTKSGKVKDIKWIEECLKD